MKMTLFVSKITKLPLNYSLLTAITEDYQLKTSENEQVNPRFVLTCNYNPIHTLFRLFTPNRTTTPFRPMQSAAGGPPITPNRSNDGTNQRLLRTPDSTSPLNRCDLRHRILRCRRHHPLEQPFNSATNPLRSLRKPLPLLLLHHTNHHPPSTFL